MKYKIILLLTLCCFAFSLHAQQVSIKGKLLNFGKKSVQMKHYSFEGAIVNKKHTLELNEKDEFNYSFELKEPAYFKIGRSFLYLSPGDKLTVTIDLMDRATAKFIGIGAEANLYLRNLPYPKGGSFITEYLKQKENPAEIVELLEAKVSALAEELEATQKLTSQFIELEKARLNFEFVNSLLMYSTYASYYLRDIKKDELNKLLADADVYFIPYINEKITSINNVRYLDFEVFKSLLYYVSKDSFRNKYEVPALNAFFKEYILATTLINELERKGLSDKLLTDYEAFKGKVEEKIFKNALEKKFGKVKNLSQGNKAEDVTFLNIDDKEVKLSHFKGNTIVVDLWATWCGPCMKEMPYFEKLKEKFADKNVKFLSVSIDKNSVWKKYMGKHKKEGIQLQIDREKLEFYNIVGIPRFFVISPNLEIITVYAPKPSDPALEKIIEKALL